jgi:hypothetical protein
MVLLMDRSYRGCEKSGSMSEVDQYLKYKTYDTSHEQSQFIRSIKSLSQNSIEL